MYRRSAQKYMLEKKESAKQNAKIPPPALTYPRPPSPSWTPRRTCLVYPYTSQLGPLHLLIALSKSTMKNLLLLQCINTRHALVKDRDSRCKTTYTIFLGTVPKKMLQIKTERTHRKHVKYMRTPKDQEHAFRRTAHNTMLVDTHCYI